MNRDLVISEIRGLISSVSLKAAGIIVNRYEGQEVGIKIHNFDIITDAGFYAGYWTDEAPQLSDADIISSIIENEDCECWEDMTDSEIKQWLDLLVTR